MNCLILNTKTTFDDAVKLLDKNGTGFLPVINEENILLGIVSDGDVRRSILNRNFDLNNIINKKPITGKFGTPHASIKRKLRELSLRHMPIINDENKLIEVVSLEHFDHEVKPNWVVIMAGGLGKRLGELTKTTPKPMLELGDKPILFRIIEQFKSFGFRKFILCVNYKSEVIKDYFGNGEGLNITIKYTAEEKPLGTGGALSLIDFDLGHPFFVVNGDVVTATDFDDFLNYHNLNSSTATMAVKRFPFEVPYACVEFNESMDLIGLKEKPTYNYYINTGMYLLNPDTLKLIPKDSFYDMTTLFQLLVNNNEPTKVFSIEEYWLDVGQPADFAKANSDISSKKFQK